MVRYAWLIDTSRCIGCNTCTITCKDQFVGNDWLPYSAAQQGGQVDSTGWQSKQGHMWMSVVVKEWGKGADFSTKLRYIPEACMLCDNPPCVAAGTNGAIYKRPDGIVIIDPVKSKGQQQIAAACPYGKIFWNDTLQIPQKCTLCAHRIDAGLQPACVNTCPVTGVMTFGDEAALASAIADKKAVVLSPELKTIPKVYYAGLPQTTT